MPASIRRISGWSLLFSLWAAAFIALSDAAYGGYFFKLQIGEWAAPVYDFISVHFGYSLADLGFFALHLALPLALAGMFLGFAALLRGGFFYKLPGLISILLSAAVLWFAVPGLCLTGIGLVMLLTSPHTHTIWDRLFAALILLLPLSSFFLYRIAARKPMPPADTATNDL